MKPFYFGGSEKQLFGIYHPSTNPTIQGRGVVLCYPIGHEYIRIHRTFRQLAVRLAKIGFHTLRFDYYGSGDSAGESKKSNLGQWVGDISTAIEKLRESAGITEIHLVGLRIGASLALLSGASRGDIESIILWEPIINGKGYIDDLIAKDGLNRINDHSNGNLEIAGFPIAGKMRADLEKLDLLSINKTPANRVLVIENHPESGAASLGQHMRNLETQFDSQQVAGAEVYDDQNEFGQGMVPYQILQSITTWIADV